MRQSVQLSPNYDANRMPGTWNERMVPGEFAVHYSSFSVKDYDGLYCSVFGSLADAEAHAKEQVAQRPTLQCTIYDHEGFVGAPFADIRGNDFKDTGSMSPRFRRWGGWILFATGSILMIIDWRTDFALMWPGMFGSRIIIPGFALLVMDALITIHQRKKANKPAGWERA